MNQFSCYSPTKVIFGKGVADQIGAETKAWGATKVLIHYGGGSVVRSGLLDRVKKSLDEAGIPHVELGGAVPNPRLGLVHQGIDLCRKEGVDFILGIGGGSAIDSAKAIAVMARQEGDFWDYVIGGSGKGRFVKEALPVVAIPTTAGTGTEVDPWAVITNEERQEKIGFGSDKTYPALSIVDPELMLSIPPQLTAYQGFDAFFHAAEGFIANCATPVSDLFALEAIRLLYKYLPVAVNDGRNLKARAKVAWASTLAGMVESTSSCTSEHSLEHAMSACYPQLPHGAGLIAVSEAYFETFRNDCMKRYMKMAEVMTQQKSNRPSDFIDALVRMKKACGVADIRLSQWGLKAEDLPQLVQNARDTMGGLFTLDPRPLTDEEVLAIYQASFR